LANGDAENYFQQEFATLLFSGSLLMHEVISLIAKEREIPNLVQQSKEILETTAALMNRIKEPVENRVQDSLGWWQVLQDLELSAQRKLKFSLRQLFRFFK